MSLALPTQHDEKARQELIGRFAAAGVPTIALQACPTKALDAVAGALLPARAAWPPKNIPQDQDEATILAAPVVACAMLTRHGCH